MPNKCPTRNPCRSCFSFKLKTGVNLVPHFSTPLREVGTLHSNAIADFVAPRFQPDALPLGPGSSSVGHSFRPETLCCPAGSEEPAFGELSNPRPQRAHGAGCEAVSDSPGPPDVAFGWRSAFSRRGISLKQTELTSASCCPTVRFVRHPLPDEIRTRDHTEPVPFPTHKIEHRRAVQFLQLCQIEQGPQVAGQRRLHQLIQI